MYEICKYFTMPIYKQKAFTALRNIIQFVGYVELLMKHSSYTSPISETLKTGLRFQNYRMSSIRLIFIILLFSKLLYFFVILIYGKTI